VDNKELSKHIISGAISITIGLAFLRGGTRSLLKSLDGLLEKIPSRTE
jgi:hypothetical protein